MEVSERLKKLPPYLFVEIDKKKKELTEKGYDVINFGVGDPDLPTPPHIVEAMKKAVENLPPPQPKTLSTLITLSLIHI